MQSQTASLAEAPADLYRVYVDTNVFHYLAAIGPPPKNEAERALAELSRAAQSDTIICVTSSLALAEEYDICKGRAFIKREMHRGNIIWRSSGISVRKPSLAEPLDSSARARAVRVIRQGLHNSVVRLEDPRDWPTELLDLLCCRSNLHWPDALHLAIALVLRCDYIVTDDKDFYDEVVARITSTGSNLHRPVSRILESAYGLTEERLQRPLIGPLYLRHSGTATTLASLGGGPAMPTH
jgi:predicted nucleic acid-binding protein